MRTNALVIDTQAVGRYCAYSMLSGGTPCIMPTPMQEIIRRFGMVVRGAVATHDPSVIIFAHDSKPYWREAWLADWYRKRAVVVDDGGPVLCYDNTFRRIPAEDGGLKPVKLKVAEAAAVTEGKTDEDLRAPDDAEAAWLPRYKGSRSARSWPFPDLTREECSRAIQTAVDRICEATGAYQAAVDGWEADDVAAIYCKGAPDAISRIVLMTHDSDWRQILFADPRVFVYDIRQVRLYGQEDRAEVKAALTVKVICGDSSDDIAGIPKGKPGAGCYGETGAAKLVVEGIPGEVKAMPEYQRNLHVILLPCRAWDAEEAYATLKAAVRRPAAKPTKDWSGLFVTERDEELLADAGLVQKWLQQLKGDV
jgi:hypothetical protein